MTVADEQIAPEQLVARSIRYHRERLHLSARQLADRIAGLGGSISRQAISKIELGERDVRINELMLIARALRMTPLLLLFPVGTQNDSIPAAVAVAGETLDMWPAAQWFTGEGYPAEAVAEHWSVPLYLYRKHERRLEELANATVGGLFVPGKKDEAAEARDQAELDIIQVRAEMKRHGLTPPKLDPGLEYLDDPNFDPKQPMRDKGLRPVRAQLDRMRDRQLRPGSGE